MEGKKETKEATCSCFKVRLMLAEAMSKVRLNSRLIWICIQLLHLIFLCKASKTAMKILYWMRPSSGIIELNIDGCCLGNPREYGGCGLTQDAKGKLIGTFSQYYEKRTNTRAEFLALQNGLRLHNKLKDNNVEVEMDSKVIVDSQ